MFDLMGLFVTGGGLVLTALSLTGALANKQRIRFFWRLFRTSDSIPRAEPVFEDFLRSFPPAKSDATVTKIMPRRLTMDNDGRDVFSSVYYEENGSPGKSAVASESEVRAWAYRTSYATTGLVITSIGFCVQVASFLLER